MTTVHISGNFRVVEKNGSFYVLDAAEKRISKEKTAHSSKEIAIIYCDKIAELEAFFI